MGVIGKFLGAAAIVALVIAGCTELLDIRSVLEMSPPSLHANQLVFERHKTWGWGPGGNETGVAVARLPEREAGLLKSGQMQILANRRCGSGGPQCWKSWSRTPIANDLYWMTHDGTGEPHLTGYKAGVGDFLDQYGFRIPLPSWVEQQFTDAMLKPGNYYSGGQAGLVVVDISKRLVFIAYVG